MMLLDVANPKINHKEESPILVDVDEPVVVVAAEPGAVEEPNFLSAPVVVADAVGLVDPAYLQLPFSFLSRAEFKLPRKKITSPAQMMDSISKKIDCDEYRSSSARWK